MAKRRTYGTVAATTVKRWHRGEEIKVPVFAFKVEPHIAMRIKRWFPRVQEYRTGLLYLDDLPAIARDVEWFCQRHPLEVGPDDWARIVARADEDRAREEAMLAVLDDDGEGYQRPPIEGWREPVRPGRDYQTKGADLAYVQGGMLLGDDLGLGKTQTAIMLLRDPATLPALIVCPTKLPAQWRRELTAIFPDLKVHTLTKGHPYDDTAHMGGIPADVDVIISNYAKLAGWRHHLAGHIEAVIFDECQELRLAVSEKYHAAAHIAEGAKWRMGLSATPIYNYGGEAHTIFEVLAPGKLGTRAEFIKEWGGHQIGSGDNVALANPAALGAYLHDQGLLLRRTRAEVGREIPEPAKILQEVPASQEVMDSVKGDLQALRDLLLAPDTKSLDRMRAAGDMDYKLRHATGVAKAPAVARFAEILLQSEEKIVMAGWHHDVYAIWQDLLAAYKPVRFTGKESARQSDASVDAFVNGDARILMMSLRSGAGLDGLQKACKTVVFGELDWAPPMHDQLIGRFARDGHIGEVTAYFCVTGSGSDPVMSKVLNVKTVQGESIRNPHADATMFAPNLGTADKTRTKMLLDAVQTL